jgi:hypothetical protein
MMAETLVAVWWKVLSAGIELGRSYLQLIALKRRISTKSKYGRLPLTLLP